MISMIRVGDTIGTAGGRVALVAEVRPGGKILARVAFGDHVTFDDWEVQLLCASPDCAREASGFLPSGKPLCETCSAGELVAILDVRPAPGPFIACACGESLELGTPEGVLAIGSPPIVCEYRRCLHCHSSRPWMARDRIESRRVEVFPNPGTMIPTFAWGSFIDALYESEPRAGYELRRGCTVLARAFACPDGASYGWRICTPERERD